ADPSPHTAYTYLHQGRGIHPCVIQDAMLGAIPSCYDVYATFATAIDDAQTQLVKLQERHEPRRGRPPRDVQQAEQRLTLLRDAEFTLAQLFADNPGWLVFFYCDAAHRPCALRIRRPDSKDIKSFKPGSIAGLFGRELFTPDKSPEHQPANDYLIAVEGECNALQVQSLLMRYQEHTGEPVKYLN